MFAFCQVLFAASSSFIRIFLLCSILRFAFSNKRICQRCFKSGAYTSHASFQTVGVITTLPCISGGGIYQLYVILIFHGENPGERYSVFGQNGPMMLRFYRYFGGFGFEIGVWHVITANSYLRRMATLCRACLCISFRCFSSFYCSTAINKACCNFSTSKLVNSKVRYVKVCAVCGGVYRHGRQSGFAEFVVRGARAF